MTVGLWQTRFKSSISQCDATAVAKTIRQEVRKRLEPAMGHKTFPWSAARTHITVLRRTHSIDDGRESREGVAEEKVWFSCKYLEVTQTSLISGRIRSAQVNRSTLMTSASG